MRTHLTLGLLAMAAATASAQWSQLPMDAGQCQNHGAATFDKIYVAGGIGADYDYTALVQTYDRSSELWNEEPILLTEERGKMACAINGDRLVCGAGIVFETLMSSATVEIFDISTNELVQVDNLSVPRAEVGVASVGDKVIFAGGMDQEDGEDTYITTVYDAVDIYDVVDDEWSTATLSQARSGMASAVLGDKAYFAGGYLGDSTVSDRIDIYDASDGSWSTATLSVARAFYGGGVAIGSKVMFAGGQLVDESSSDVVDILDTLTGVWSTANISAARYGIQAATTGDFAIFAGGGEGFLHDWYYTASSNVVDIYNDQSGQWSTATMTDARVNFLAVGAGNQVFLVGGTDIVAVTVPATMDVFTDLSAIGMAEHAAPAPLQAWPNPCSDKLNLGALDALAGCTVEVYDVQGTRVSSTRLRNTLSVDLSALADGLYQVRVLAADGARALMCGPVVKGR